MHDHDHDLYLRLQDLQPTFPSHRYRVRKLHSSHVFNRHAAAHTGAPPNLRHCSPRHWSWRYRRGKEGGGRQRRLVLGLQVRDEGEVWQRERCAATNPPAARARTSDASDGRSLYCGASPVLLLATVLSNLSISATLPPSHRRVRRSIQRLLYVTAMLVCATAAAAGWPVCL